MFLKKIDKFVVMQMISYIQDLLYRYECVIVPGFGAFLTHYYPASVSENIFLPPRKEVSFNKQLQANDGVLANYVAAVEHCNYEVALQRVRNFVTLWASTLSEKKEFNIPSIGLLKINEEGNTVFFPEKHRNYLSTSFGLTPYEITTLKREGEKQPIIFIPNEVSENNVKKPLLRYAAIGILAITLGGFSGLKIYENQVAQHNFVEKEKAATLLENQIQEATFVLDNPLPSLTLFIPKISGNYHIIAGAFKIEENATKKISQLIEKGFPARSIGPNKYGLHQVVYQSYETREEALQGLKAVKRTENPAAWLLIQELKD